MPFVPPDWSWRSRQIACVRDAGDCAPAAEVSWSAAPAASVTDAPEARLAGWAPGQPAPAATEPAVPASLTVVLDTNVLIHGVGFVLDLRDSFIEGERQEAADSHWWPGWWLRITC